MAHRRQEDLGEEVEGMGRGRAGQRGRGAPLRAGVLDTLGHQLPGDESPLTSWAVTSSYLSPDASV